MRAKKKFLVPVLALALVGIGISPASAGKTVWMCDQYHNTVTGLSGGQSASTTQLKSGCGQSKVRAYYSRSGQPGFVTNWTYGGLSVSISPGSVTSGRHDVSAPQAGYGGVMSS